MSEQQTGQVTRYQPRPEVDLTKPLTSLQQALELSDVLARSDLVPRALYGKPASIFHVVMTGQALGLHWTESIRVIYSPGPGQIGMRGAFLLAQLRKAGHRYSASYSDDGDACTFVLTRGDTKEKFEATFTVDDAIAAGLARRLDNGNVVALSRDNRPLPWMAWRKRMLRWRAVSDGVGFGAPEVMLGFEVEGATEAQEPQPEVLLKPQVHEGGEVPAEALLATSPDAGALRRLDEQVRADTGVADAPPPDSPREEDPDADEAILAELKRADAAAVADDDIPDEPAATSGAEGSASGLDNEPGRTPGRAAAVAKSKVLTDAFKRLGWDPKQYRPNVLHACTMFMRRRINGVRDMTAGEMMILTDRLNKIARDNEEEHYVVAVADAVEGWRELWEREDPAGFEKYTSEGA